MAARQDRKYVFLALGLHALILAVLIIGVDFSLPPPVLENTNKHDVVSAVILGDTAKSKILPSEPITPPPPQPEIKKELPIKTKKTNDLAQSQKLQQAQMEKEAIALKMAENKKQAQQKAVEAKKQRDLLEKNLLADIRKQKDKQKKIKQKQLEAQFQKMLQQQAEKTLRQQWLDENIKLHGKQTREAQGVVNKYAALIKQAIEARWILPPQVNKKVFCELMIRLGPGGTVLDVRITRSSGDPSLDSSARAAVFKASPLPVPSDRKAFESFRQFALKVKPENVLASEGL